MTATVLLALLGLAVGSFINLCCDRLPYGRSIVTPASHELNRGTEMTPLPWL